jgi:poly(3-hydroxybutyrate) depolymerase
VLSAQASAEWFARVLELAPAGSESVEEVAGLPVHQQDWIAPSGHVRLVTIEGGGHTVPQAAYRSQRILGATLRSDAVLESIWRLFSEGER